MKQLFLALLGMTILSGCAMTPMTVNLAPDTQVPMSDIGNGHTIRLSVVDERETQDIGQRGGAGFAGASIKLDKDLTTIVQTAVSDMLGRKGFKVVYTAAEQAQSTLRVDIRGLSYSTSTGFWTGGVHVDASMRADAKGALESYDNFYRYNNEDRVYVVPGADANNEKINTALNDVLHQMLSDNKLLEVLAKTN